MNIPDRKITMYCPICGNDQFSCTDNDVYDLSDAPDDIKLKCSDCNSIITKGELIESNQDIINANIEDITDEALKELKRELKKIFK